MDVGAVWLHATPVVAAPITSHACGVVIDDQQPNSLVELVEAQRQGRVRILILTTNY